MVSSYRATTPHACASALAAVRVAGALTWSRPVKPSPARSALVGIHISTGEDAGRLAGVTKAPWSAASNASAFTPAAANSAAAFAASPERGVKPSQEPGAIVRVAAAVNQ